MIPKLIHYCWLSNDPIPADLQMFVDSWRHVLSDYEFILWNFDRFDKETSQWVKEAFDNKKYAFAADYIRLYALYNYGGIYLDMDVEVLKTFNPFLCLKTMICYENGKLGLEMATFGVEIHSVWVKDCLAYYENRPFVKSDGLFDMITLPVIIMNTCIKCGYRFITVKSIEEARNVDDLFCIPVFPSDYFSPKSSFKNNKIYRTDNTVSIHHFAGTWLPWYSKVEKRFFNFWGLESKDFIRRVIYKLRLDYLKLKSKKR